ncbi:class I SAM-dependent methyltransferase [Streptomyces sp. WAC 04229]|uniref:daptide-type RiPP biosynthesis methyltransferase n=1 Tax=Streptomyces sp. WAC 04229 TaxID=2203206 RepID=UPI0003E0B5EC|nr:daptide-type RiPP biosynthesis methyltransferase [Streptomyces sp. WAC 04229]AGO98995.1 N-methyltransferase [Streptomyces sp. WAC 04229]RSN59709.1 class I SAM-dependent methyltransferase [Streptomyces sp. WAC 04229]
MSDQLEHGPVRTTRADTLLAAVGERGVLRSFYDEDIGSDLMQDADGLSEAQVMGARIRSALGPVLELAAGTGRLTFPFLTLGFEVTALELSTAMAATLRRQLENGPADLRDRCTVVQGDMSAFALDQRFGAVVISYGSINLLDDTGRRGLYASVRDHLEPGGTFLISMADTGGSQSLERDQELSGRSGRRYVLHVRRSPAEAIQDITVYPADDTSDPFVVCTSRLRLLEPQQVVRELEQAGFDVLEPAPFRSAGGSGRPDALLLEASWKTGPA